MANSFSTNLGIAQVPEIDQSKYPSIYAEFIRMRQALGTLQDALDRYTGVLGETDSNYWPETPDIAYVRVGNITTFYALATDNIGYAQPSQVYNNAGSRAVRLAQGGPAYKQCNCICMTSGGVTAGNFGKFMLVGLVTGFAGLTSGALYYLNSAAPGTITATAPTTAGYLEQEVGFALSPTELWFNPTLAIRIV